MAATVANGNDIIVANLVTGAMGNDDNAHSDDGIPTEPVTPKPKAARKPRVKKAPVKSESEDNEEATLVTSSTTKVSTGKKRGAEVDGDTPTKKPKTAKPKASKEPKAPKEPKASKEPKAPQAVKEPKATNTTLKGKAANAGFPTCLAEFDAADRLLFDMKNQKNAWPIIEEAWTKLTGKVPGKDVLRKRYPKLIAVAQDFKIGDGVKIAEAKKAIDDEIASSIRKLNLERWTKVAARMVENGSDSYKAGALENKWNNMVKNSEVDGEGKYIGTGIAAPEDSLEGADEAAESDNYTTNNGEDNGNGSLEEVEEGEDA